MAEEDWTRFLPKFTKKNTSKRKQPLVVREKKAYTPFPPAQTPSKKDLQLDSGEYFLNEAQREAKKRTEKKAAAKEKSVKRQQDREAEFRPPDEADEEDDDDDLAEFDNDDGINPEVYAPSSSSKSKKRAKVEEDVIDEPEVRSKGKPKKKLRSK